MQDTYRSLDSRMNQEVLRRNVLRVLRIWRSWFIFSDDFLNGLQASSLLLLQSHRLVSACFSGGALNEVSELHQVIAISCASACMATA